MVRLNIFSKPPPAELALLPTGSVTVDRDGQIAVSTLPHGFPRDRVQQIIKLVLSVFRTAEEAQLHFTEIEFYFAALKITARSLRGGAMIFLSPRSLKQA